MAFQPRETKEVTAFGITISRMNVDGSRTLIVETTYDDGTVEVHELFPISTRPVG